MLQNIFGVVEDNKGMELNILLRFLMYGAFGWVLEVVWTGLHSLLRGDFSMRAQTSIWMFFIYGMFVVMEPFFALLAPWPFVVRGVIYMVGVFVVEYVVGRLMQQANICPWDYSDARTSVHGVIRLDYAPVWFSAGLMFEVLYGIIR